MGSQTELLARLEAARRAAASIGADGSPLALAVERLECEVAAARQRMADLERRATMALAALADLEGSTPPTPAPVMVVGEMSQADATTAPVIDSAACEPTAPMEADSAVCESLDPAPARSVRTPRRRKAMGEGEVQTARCAPLVEADLPAYWSLAVGPLGAPHVSTRDELTR